MSSLRRKDRSALCTFTFSDGRQCSLPRRTGHLSLCPTHARKEAQILGSEQAGEAIANHLAAPFVSACDLSAALARIISAAAQGHLRPKTAATLAYLGQTLAHTLPIAQHEYINAFGTEAWRKAIRSSICSASSSANPGNSARELPPSATSNPTA
ncbi:MAG: hypothetical protein JSS69_04570 [Acidobacteria bacterium]|nr:hypothetical protein [Acidobacteriota bacterium]MBS1865171.1 hypothetical protein [Acidobacteriota bacterium]